MELPTIVFFTIVFLFFLVHGLDLYHKRRMPPGPAGLPIIGNLLDIGPKPHESLAKLSLKHGPLMTIRLGSVTSVVASTPDAAREILQRHDDVCSGRMVPDAVTALENHNMAVLWISANEDWRTIRRALNTYLTHQHKLDTLRDLRQNVVEGMLEFLRASALKNECVNIGKLAFAVALNQISNTCISQNVTNYESDDIGGFKTAVKTIMEVAGKVNIADIFPILKPLDPQNIRQQAKAAYGWFDQVILGFINERIKHRESKLPRFGDMLDSLLDYSEDNVADFNLVHIKILLVEKMEKSMEKILDLPYLHAVIKETMRLHLSVPLLAPHKTENQVKLGDYIVPKNIQILVNVWAMARDPMYWENPLSFMPERFLKSEVDYKGQHFQFLPFGSGRRMCPGIPLAHRVVTLMVASFVYHFDWELTHPREEMDMNDIFGLALLRATPLVAYPISTK
ncbi:putative geraniol 8-hydroxylase [Helianthus annuus]|nr:putative geraniol 8-hydroxylase [Helianthus annuus]